jgi:hypothetical protein
MSDLPSLSPELLADQGYVHGVERPHGLPVARRQARIRRGTGNRYLDNLYEEYLLTARNSTVPPHTRLTSGGVISGVTMRLWESSR